jgi:hypothetical protein
MRVKKFYLTETVRKVPVLREKVNKNQFRGEIEKVKAGTFIAWASLWRACFTLASAAAMSASLTKS